MEQKRLTLSLREWIERYGGQALLDREGFDVVPCNGECGDLICHGWRVQRKPMPPHYAFEFRMAKKVYDSPDFAPICLHDRLDEDGICRACGADRRRG